MRSLSNLRLRIVQFSEIFGNHICRKNASSLSLKTGPSLIKTTKPTSLQSCSTWTGSVLRPIGYQLYINNNATLELPTSPTCTPLGFPTPFLPHMGNILGYLPSDESIVGYIPSKNSDMKCSSLLKKRKKKMNKHKYKKRRKRDKFKRRNLENIKERKRRMREKADERAKSALV
ncbi:uncharacterized protein LOC110254001 [Exaiptasia diaphana]|uniref:Ribosomal protein mS38 C-terminal domain-containing protein n=1 Tax=Exaiptasia diaphana TaxID=2652724 RepID=A0A913Y829_EXADI|nr:uncharacterized protein LOC110254001 [Exaiptasia diaphana]KXJ21542.1 hypothetical protein AC249_AIPGENE1071 [Exaiptasia diaphana]